MVLGKGITHRISLLIFLSSMALTPAWSINSTSVVRPNITPIPWILTYDSGFIDYDEVAGSTSNQPMNCNSLTQSYNYFATHRKCPTDYTPYMSTAPYKEQQVGNGFTGQCIRGLFDNGTYYLVFYYTSAIITSTGTCKRGTSFNWTMYCYPSTITPPAYDTQCQTPASTNLPILTWEEGYVQNNNPSSQQQIVQSTRQCPLNYSPYVMMFASVNANLVDKAISSSGACVNGVFARASGGYDIWYLARSIFAFTGVSSGGTSNTSPTGLYWVLYCYPPGNTPPLDQVNTGGSGKTPYNSGCGVNTPYF